MFKRSTSFTSHCWVTLTAWKTSCSNRFSCKFKSFRACDKAKLRHMTISWVVGWKVAAILGQLTRWRAGWSSRPTMTQICSCQWEYPSTNTSHRPFSMWIVSVIASINASWMSVIEEGQLRGRQPRAPGRPFRCPFQFDIHVPNTLPNRNE